MEKEEKMIKCSIGNSIASLGTDVLRSILSRLPALSFAKAACTCRSWRSLCHRILFSRPKLLSSLSLRPILSDAFDEASSKILSEPIRPHFVIASVGKGFSLAETHQLVIKRFGAGIPVITCSALGIIGIDAITNEIKEVLWDDGSLDETGELYNTPEDVDKGFLLVVGFLPGLKVHVIPLLHASEISSRDTLIDSFLRDIKTYTASISGYDAPMGIVMFADRDSDMRYVLDKMDCSLGRETVIVGDERAHFVFNDSEGNGSGIGIADYSTGYESLAAQLLGIQRNYEAVALVFAKDKNKHHGDTGEIQFSLLFSAGVSPKGPTYKAASVRVNCDRQSGCCTTWLTARREWFLQRLDGLRILSDLEGEVGHDKLNGDFYVGVMKQRKCSRSRKGKFRSCFSFHEVKGADEEYLYIVGDGIRTGDVFQFYFPDVETAMVSRGNVFEELKVMNNRGAQDGKREKVFGGLIFTCYGRGESFFGELNVNSSAFSDNLPGVPLAGLFCMGEIGRLSSSQNDDKELNPADSCLHVYSCLYLVMHHLRGHSECGD